MPAEQYVQHFFCPIKSKTFQIKDQRLRTNWGYAACSNRKKSLTLITFLHQCLQLFIPVLNLQNIFWRFRWGATLVFHSPIHIEHSRWVSHGNWPLEFRSPQHSLTISYVSLRWNDKTKSWTNPWDQITPDTRRILADPSELELHGSGYHTSQQDVYASNIPQDLNLSFEIFTAAKPTRNRSQGELLTS